MACSGCCTGCASRGRRGASWTREKKPALALLWWCWLWDDPPAAPWDAGPESPSADPTAGMPRWDETGPNEDRLALTGHIQRNRVCVEATAAPTQHHRILNLLNWFQQILSNRQIRCVFVPQREPFCPGPCWPQAVVAHFWLPPPRRVPPCNDVEALQYEAPPRTGLGYLKHMDANMGLVNLRCAHTHRQNYLIQTAISHRRAYKIGK